MSTVFRATKKCAVCHKEYEYGQIGSTNAFGPCDLDLRPPEMQRSTMPLWVEECPFCGYVSRDISTLPRGTAEQSIVAGFISSRVFQSGGGHTFSSDLACRFYKLHILSKEFANSKDAFYSAVHAAWACDDEGDKANAILCRKSALEFLELLIAEDVNNENLSIQKADLLRRAGEFDAVIEEYKDKQYSSELLNKIIRFQIEKSKLGDDACYTVADSQAL